MTYIVAANRVFETTTTTGTGALTLAGAVTGYRAFSTIPGIASGDTLPYSVWGVDSNGVPTGEWETGVGTYATTLTRTAVEDSSNSGAAVSFSAGTKVVAFGVNAGSWNRSNCAGAGRHVLSCDFTSNNNGQQDGGLQVALSSSGTATTGPAATYAEHPGCSLIRSSTSANSGGGWVWGNPGLHGTRTMASADVKRMNFIFRTAAANTNVVVRFGTSETSSAQPDAANGVYFEIQPGTWDMVSKTASSSTRTTNALATLTANTWYHARFTNNANNTSIFFELFSEAGALLGSATHTTNIPTADIYPFAVRAASTGTTAVDLVVIDYADLDLGYTKPLARGRLYG